MELVVRPPDCLSWPGGNCRCALGRSGVSLAKREGDGATPVGRFLLREIFYRPDRLARPHSALLIRALEPDMGWCDEPSDPGYNRLVRLPYDGRCETMWRDDGLYDLLVVLGHNDDPPQPDLGSAIFLHVAGPDFGPTEGCVALALPDLQALVARLEPGSAITIQPG
ncbi:MAG: L,D-transpeptidase family protein [Rhodospirillales bacterium]|nr:L,D-transpeptidase family protein [Rhodospirillales bacterium]